MCTMKNMKIQIMYKFKQDENKMFLEKNNNAFIV